MSSHRTRIRIVIIGIIGVALVLVLNLYNMQIVQGHNYASKAGDQYEKPASTLFDRGTIYFSSKDNTKVAAATVDRGNLIFINPKLIQNPEQAFNALSDLLKLDHNTFIKYATNTSNPYKELAHKVDDVTASSIAALKIKGLNITPESWRSYPGDILAAQTLGIVGESVGTSTISGKYGLEKYYDSVLNRPGIGSSVSIFAEIFAGVKNVFVSDDSEGSIVTTIEPTVENYLEKVLADTNATWHPDEIGGIIMNPTTGEIYAMSSLPTFNGNDTSSVKDPAVFSNPLVEHVYEMGSIVKPITISIGLDTKAIKTNSTYDDTGSMTLDGKKISNYDGKARGVTDIQTILSQSLNVGAATVGLKVGSENMSKYMANFGLGEKTGIDLPNEAKGLIGKLKNGSDIDIATASFGQGIAVSPIEVARALSVLANNGSLVTPHVVKEIDFDDGTKKVTSLQKSAQVISAETAHDVTTMLVKVVDVALKNGRIKMDRYSIAAKTGTAQIADHANGGYYTDRYLHSFFGYFPAYDPKFIVFLYQIYPKGAQYASDTLTDPFDNLAKFLLNYYNVPPDR